MDEVIAERVVRLAAGPAIVTRVERDGRVIEQVVALLEPVARRPHRTVRRPVCRARLAAA